MRKFSILIVLLAVSLRITLAQNGYNYDRPDVNLSGGSRPQGFPTTPTYSAPTGSQGGQSGYNYPAQSDTDFPTVPSSGATGPSGYPSGPQRPTNVGASSYAPPQAGPAGGNYPAAGAPGGNYPAPGQPQAGRPGSIGGGGFNQGATAPGSFGQGGIQGGGFQGGVVPGSSSSSGSSSGSGQQDESQEGDYSAIPGEPEIDYPIFSEIPQTSFDCNQQEYPGYYADVEARCQVFHICALNKTFDFLCPNGTIFSQETLVCVWWNQFDCNSAPGLFANNANLYDNSQQGAQAGAGPAGAQADTFGGPTGPYPAAGRPQAPTSFGTTGPNAYQPSGPAAGGNYPSAGAPALGPNQAPYPSAGAQIPPSNVPSSSYQPPQSDSPYPASGVPQTQTTPSRDYLPPRRG